MTDGQYEAMVRRLEEYARQQPQSYRRRVGLLAALGYAYIFLVLALLAVLIGAVVLIMVYGHVRGGLVKIIIALGALAFLILRSLWVQIPAPEGLELDRATAPRLFEMLDELTTALRAPRFHHVLLTGDFNAAVVQVPRLGILGWQRNYLLLGLPLMQALPPEQFRAVVAHELGHLSGNHSRFAGWIYRVQRTWGQLLEALERESHWGTFIFVRFFHWYAPYFSGYSFALRRADEYVADRCAAELAGARNAAEALIGVEINGNLLSHSFWPNVYRQANQQPEPPAATFTAMLGALRAGAPPVEATPWLDRALAEKTGYQDTHPSLSDRLSALRYLPTGGDGRHPSVPERLAGLGHPPAPGDNPEGEPWRPPLPGPVEETAAGHYLGDAVERFTAQLEHAWRQAVAPQWRERYQYAQQSQQELRALEEKARTQPLTEEEAWKRARWTAEFQGSEAAVPLLQEMLAAHPGHAAASYTLGQILLERKDESGIRYIEQAMERDAEAVLPGCQAVYAFLKQQGREAEAVRYRERAREHYEQLARAHQERATVTERDRFEPHGLPDTELARLREQLSQHEQVGAAYLVRKAVTLFPERPLFVLGVRLITACHKIQSEQEERALTSRLGASLQLPGEGYIIILNRNTAGLGKALQKVEGAEIYRR
jgi:Zn-dependent protease with chaperone function